MNSESVIWGAKRSFPAAVQCVPAAGETVLQELQITVRGEVFVFMSTSFYLSPCVICNYC